MTSIRRALSALTRRIRERRATASTAAIEDAVSQRDVSGAAGAASYSGAMRNVTGR